MQFRFADDASCSAVAQLFSLGSKHHYEFMTLLWITLGLAGVGVAAFIFVSLRDATYRRSGHLPAFGTATMADVERLVQDGERIAAIRVYREFHHVGLAEAKKAIDDLHVAA
jgi:hypothetical protein